MADEQQAIVARYYWPNKLGRIYLLALEDVKGRSGINAVLNQAKLRYLINNYPSSDLSLGWSFEEMSAVNQALEELYGPLGGRAVAIRAGRASLHYFLEDLGAIVGITNLALRLLPLSMKIKEGLNAIADTFNKTSDQIVRVEEQPERFLFHVDRCPVCWGRTAAQPVCHLTLGVLEETLHWATNGREFNIQETLCIARGDPSCTYVIPKRPTNGRSPLSLTSPPLNTGRPVVPDDARQRSDAG